MLEKAAVRRESRASKQGLPSASIICREGKKTFTHTLPPTYTHTHTVPSASKTLHTQLPTKSRQRDCNLQRWRKTWMNPRARKVSPFSLLSVAPHPFPPFSSYLFIGRCSLDFPSQMGFSASISLLLIFWL
ncbi:hypothetical protein AMECASPLE_023174 [Ameca splendens]|uniref:Uncharacterized protein n=1 Tax=Ameca splendens TaxID=208324 RepID=A0ABV0YFP0_9TELE